MYRNSGVFVGVWWVKTQTTGTPVRTNLKYMQTESVEQRAGKERPLFY